MRMTGPAKLSSLCKDYNLPPEFSKDEFLTISLMLNISITLDLLLQQTNCHQEKFLNIIKTAGWGSLFLISEKCLTSIRNLIVYLLLSFCIDCQEHFLILLISEQSISSPVQHLLIGSYWKTFHQELSKLCNDRSVYAWIRQTIQGGRCFIQKGYFKSLLADKFTTPRPIR